MTERTGIELEELHESPTGNLIKHEVGEKKKNIGQ